MCIWKTFILHLPRTLINTHGLVGTSNQTKTIWKAEVKFPFQWPSNGMNWRPQWLYFYSLASGPNCQPQRTQTIYTQSGQDQMLAISSVPHLLPPFQTWDCWAHRYPPLPSLTIHHKVLKLGIHRVDKTRCLALAMSYIYSPQQTWAWWAHDYLPLPSLSILLHQSPSNPQDNKLAVEELTATKKL
jgi:hypothetical protein